MKINKKKAARVKREPSRNPRNPRKAATAAPGGRVRRCDTVELLYKRGQIDRRQFAAAMRYREADELCRGTGDSPLANMDRIRSGGVASPTEAQLRAAYTVAEASRLLGLMDHNLVRLVVCDGFTVEEAAARLFGKTKDASNKLGDILKANRADAEHTGRRLRVALDVLGQAWFPRRTPGMRASRAPVTDESAPQPGEINRGRVVHATRWRNYDI